MLTRFYLPDDPIESRRIRKLPTAQARETVQVQDLGSDPGWIIRRAVLEYPGKDVVISGLD